MTDHGEGAGAGTGLGWRHGLLGVVTFGSLLWLLSLEPLAQSTAYHAFVDGRSLLGIPRFADVISNLPFALVGLLGIRLARRTDLGAQRRAWSTLFIGIALVSLGSAYYHLTPNSATLVWDRLPMSIGFMGLTAALLGEFVHTRLGQLTLWPAVLLGLASVLYWAAFDDLRPYFWVQLVALLLIPTVLILFESRYSRGCWLLVALGWYALAKAAEAHDRAIFELTGELVSGHTLKHLLAAAGCYSIYAMLARRRERRQPGPAGRAQGAGNGTPGAAQSLAHAPPPRRSM